MQVGGAPAWQHCSATAPAGAKRVQRAALRLPLVCKAAVLAAHVCISPGPNRGGQEVFEAARWGAAAGRPDEMTNRPSPKGSSPCMQFKACFACCAQHSMAWHVAAARLTKAVEGELRAARGSGRGGWGGAAGGGRGAWCGRGAPSGRPSGRSGRSGPSRLGLAGLEVRECCCVGLGGSLGLQGQRAGVRKGG